MWVDAQRDGRPAEYRWRPLLNVVDQIAKISLWWNLGQKTAPRSHRRRCSNEAKTRNPLKFDGLLQTHQPISAVNRPKFTVLWGYCEDMWRTYCCVTIFFSIVDTCLTYEDIVRQSCAMVRRWRIFASCISSQPCAAHFRHAFWIHTKGTSLIVEVWYRHPICGRWD